jgi:hypothetical protein
VEKPLLIADVRGDEIIVRTLGFYAVYAKPSNAPQLILTRRTETNDHALLARAWQFTCLGNPLYRPAAARKDLATAMPRRARLCEGVGFGRHPFL